MLVKINLKQDQVDALKAFIDSDDNYVKPPKGFYFVEALRTGRLVHGSRGVPVVSMHKISGHVSWFAITVEVRECIAMLGEFETSQQDLAGKPHYYFSAEVLIKMFAAINRFPEEKPFVSPWDPSWGTPV